MSCQPRAIVAWWRAVFDLGEEREIRVALSGACKGRVAFDEKYVTCLQANVADFGLGDANALSVNGEDRSVVNGAKAALPDGLADE